MLPFHPPRLRAHRVPWAGAGGGQKEPQKGPLRTRSGSPSPEAALVPVTFWSFCGTPLPPAHKPRRRVWVWPVCAHCHPPPRSAPPSSPGTRHPSRSRLNVLKLSRTTPAGLPRLPLSYSPRPHLLTLHNSWCCLSACIWFMTDPHRRPSSSGLGGGEHSGFADHPLPRAWLSAAPLNDRRNEP